MTSSDSANPSSAQVTPEGDRADSKKLIADSYNTIAPKYHSWASPRPTTDRAGYISFLGNSLPKGSRVVELGCGAGVPATQQLVEQGFDVTGVDVSSGLIEIARNEVEGARFEVNDMLGYVNSQLAKVDEPGYLRPLAIVAFYTIWHLPPSEQCILIQRSCQLLAPGGWLILTMMAIEGEMKMDEWMGAPMISWGLGVEGNRKIFKGLVDQGVLLQPPALSASPNEERDGLASGWEGVVRLEKVGKMEQEMHWFCLQKAP